MKPLLRLAAVVLIFLGPATLGIATSPIVATLCSASRSLLQLHPS